MVKNIVRACSLRSKEYKKIQIGLDYQNNYVYYTRRMYRFASNYVMEPKLRNQMICNMSL